MPAAKRSPQPHTDAWETVEQPCLFPEQRRYERMRGPVVFGDNIPAHAGATHLPKRTLRQDVTDFERYSMISVFRPFKRPDAQDGRGLTPPMRQHLVDCHLEHPALTMRELAAICYVKFGRRPSHHTVKRIWRSGPAPSLKERRYPLWSALTSSYAQHKANIDLHTEGWMPHAIAAYLGTSRQTVYAWLKQFKTEGFAGLEPRANANTHPVRKVDLALKTTAQQILDQTDVGKAPAVYPSVSVYVVVPVSQGGIISDDVYLSRCKNSQSSTPP